MIDVIKVQNLSREYMYNVHVIDNDIVFDLAWLLIRTSKNITAQWGTGNWQQNHHFSCKFFVGHY